MLTFYRATAEDIDLILALERQAFDIPWTRLMLEDSLRSPYRFIVAQQYESVVGYAIDLLIAAESQVLTIAVAPAFQGRGYGRALLKYLLNTAKNQGATQVYLEVRLSNQRAISLYRSMGFQLVGKRLGYYPVSPEKGGGREDALVFCLELIGCS